MTAHTRRIVGILDILILVLGLIVLVVADTGGGTFRVAGMRVSVRSVWRPAVWALVVVVVRLLLDRATGPFGLTWPSVRTRLGLDERLVSSEAGDLPGWREILLVGAGISAAVALVLHDQMRSLYLVPDLGDPLFSMWRMAWVAHQVIADPRHLFDANTFFPEPATLTFSDSMILPALTAAPLLWAGVPLPVAYNLLFLSAFVLSGVATYLLGRALALPRPAAWVAGLIFALYPFRIDHYSHLELQMTQWIPLTLLAAHRLVRTGGRRYAAYLALALGAQWYSAMYYGLFLTIYAGVFVCALCLAWRTGWRRLGMAVAGLLLGVALALPLARMYQSTEAARGVRSPAVVRSYSARAVDYAQPTRGSRWYGGVDVGRHAERALFPNLVPLALGAIALCSPLTATRFALVAAGVVAFEGSLGLNGHWYPLAYELLGPVQSVRVPARFAIFVGMTLALLAGHAVHRVSRRLGSKKKGVVFTAVVTAAFLIESLPARTLVPVWRHPPGLYSSLASQEGAVLFEYPITPQPYYFEENLPYMYFSTWHWIRMVNGYSGSAPLTYHQLAYATEHFPLGESVAYLQRVGVTHVAVHCALWADGPCAQTMAHLDDDRRFRLAAATTWQGKPARLYELTR